MRKTHHYFDGWLPFIEKQPHLSTGKTSRFCEPNLSLRKRIIRNGVNSCTKKPFHAVVGSCLSGRHQQQQM